MSKYLKVLIAAVLVIASMYSTLLSVNQGVTVGAGGGIDETVEDFTDIVYVLQFVNERKNSNDIAGTNNSGAELISSNHKNTISTELSSHSSVTMIEDTVYEETYHYRTPYYPSNSLEPSYKTTGKSYVRVVRELTSYLTKSESYYVSKGRIERNHETYADEDREKTFSNFYLDFDINVFIGKSEAYIQINKFNQTLVTKSDSETNEIKSEYIGKWIELSVEDAVDILNSTTRYDESNLIGMQMLITYGLMDEDEIESMGIDFPGFQSDGTVHTLSKEITTKDDDGKEQKIGDYRFVVNLSDRVSPYLELKSNQSYLSDSSFILNAVSFNNIDNTVVDFDCTIDYKFDDLDEFSENVFK